MDDLIAKKNCIFPVKTLEIFARIVSVKLKYEFIVYIQVQGSIPSKNEYR